MATRKTTKFIVQHFGHCKNKKMKYLNFYQQMDGVIKLWYVHSINCHAFIKRMTKMST